MGTKKEKVSWTAGEKLMVFNFVAGGLCILATVAPHLPWRYAVAQSCMTQRFAFDRSYSLLHIGDNLGRGMSWFKLKKDVCHEMLGFNGFDPKVAIMKTMAQEMGTGGALVGCVAWPACTQVVSQRCSAYTVMASVGVICALLQLVSASAAFAFPVMLTKEAKFLKKNKPKLDAAKTQTMICGVVAFVTGFLSWITWTVLSDMTFKDLASKSAYPYPSASVGIYLAGFAIFLFCIAFFQCLNRVYYFVGGKPSDEDEVYVHENEAGAAALMPDAALCHPHSAPQQFK
ncbi:unnamed protein product [Prorocentrum cordatum]|uniref:Uncharacterized protein n=1 Tax=Prorocentrum cordatum TaxID=2364126 RepID=A0ABN9TMT8_9DINO|nr:unnamed protein product [Polarella glacialis]